MLLIFLDTETTGLNPEKHRTLEIAYKVMDSEANHVIVGYEAIVRQTAEVWAEADPESLEINGFSWEDILEGKTEKAIEGEILNDLNFLNLREKGGVFICQNPSFDRIFFTQIINADLQSHNGWPYHWLDLASMYWGVQMKKDPHFSKRIKESDLSKNKIAQHYGLNEEKKPHRAMNGVNHLIECYKAIFH